MTPLENTAEFREQVAAALRRLNLTPLCVIACGDYYAVMGALGLDRLDTEALRTLLDALSDLQDALDEAHSVDGEQP